MRLQPQHQEENVPAHHDVRPITPNTSSRAFDTLQDNWQRLSLESLRKVPEKEQRVRPCLADIWRKRWPTTSLRRDEGLVNG